MSELEMKNRGDLINSPAKPPPYTPSQSADPTVAQTVPTAVIHSGMTRVIHGPSIIAVQSPVVIPKLMSPKPTPIQCQSCNLQIVTQVNAMPTTKTHIFAAVLCILGCWPCAWIPYCMPSLRKVDHFCPNCNAFIGIYRS